MPTADQILDGLREITNTWKIISGQPMAEIGLKIVDL